MTSTAALALTWAAGLGVAAPAAAQDPVPATAHALPASGAAAELPLDQVPPAPAPASRPVRSLDEQPEVRRLYEEARVAFEAGDAAGTVAHLNDALDEASGDYFELAYLMGLAKLRLDAVGEARTFAELAVALRPDSADGHYLLGGLYVRQADLARATGHFRSATLAADREPDNPHVTAAWFWLGRCLAERGYLAAAAEAYARFDAAVGSEHPEHRSADEVAAVLVDRPHGLIEARLELRRRLGRAEDAIRAAAEAASARPDDVYLARLYARALLQGGRAEEAFAFCRERLTGPAGPDGAAGAATSPLLSQAVAAGGMSGQLEPWVAEVIAKPGPGGRDEFAEALARRLTEAQRHDLAAQLREALARRRPDDAEAAWALATALRAAGRAAAAVETLGDWIRQHPDQVGIPSAALQGWLHGAPGGPTTVPELAQLAARPERDWALNLALATAAGAAEQFELADRLFQDVRDQRPDCALAPLAWGWLRLALYRWQDAQAQAQVALGLRPDLAAAHDLLGRAHAGLDENEPAEQAFKAALRYAPEDAGYALDLAEHYQRTGSPLAAQRYFQQALTLDPVNVPALEQLVHSYREAGKLELARAQLRRAEAADFPEDTLRRLRTALRFAGGYLQDEHRAELARQFAEFPQDLETGITLAAALLEVADRPDEAQPVLARILAQDPQNDRARLLMARAHGRRLEYQQAARVLEGLTRQYPRRLGYLTLLAGSYLADFRLEEARRILSQMLATDLPDTTRALVQKWLLQTYADFSEFDAALRLLDEWLTAAPTASAPPPPEATEPTDTQTSPGRAAGPSSPPEEGADREEQTAAWVREKLHLLILAGRATEAIDTAAQRWQPLEAEVARLWAQLRELVQRLQVDADPAVRSTAEQVNAELQPKLAALSDRRAELVQVALEAGRFELVLVRTEAWLAADYGDEDMRTEALGWRVQALIAAERPDEAIELLKAFRANTPQGEIAARGWRALAHAAAGRVDQAAELLREILAQQPSVLTRPARDQVWQQLVALLSDAGRYDEALRACADWLAEFERGETQARAGVLRLKALVLVRAGRTDEYIRTNEEVLRLRPDDAGANNDLGYSWADAGRNVDQALLLVRKAVADEPLRAAYLDSLGWVYYKLGDFSVAAEYLGRAARLREGQDAVIFDHLGDALCRLGDLEAAGRHWRRAVELLESPPADAPPAAGPATGTSSPGAPSTGPFAARRATGPSPADLKQLASVRAKLAALQRGEPPPVAPTADEQARQTPAEAPETPAQEPSK